MEEKQALQHRRHLEQRSGAHAIGVFLEAVLPVGVVVAFPIGQKIHDLLDLPVFHHPSQTDRAHVVKRDHDFQAAGLYFEQVEVLYRLTDGICESHADWKYRFKENSDKMRTGSLLDVAEVLKGLLLLAQGKPLSFREKKMLERARYLLVSELAMSKNWQESEIEDLLNKALSKSKLRFPEASSMES